MSYKVQFMIKVRYHLTYHKTSNIIYILSVLYFTRDMEVDLEALSGSRLGSRLDPVARTISTSQSDSARSASSHDCWLEGVSDAILSRYGNQCIFVSCICCGHCAYHPVKSTQSHQCLTSQG